MIFRDKVDSVFLVLVVLDEKEFLKMESFKLVDKLEFLEFYSEKLVLLELEKMFELEKLLELYKIDLFLFSNNKLVFNFEELSEE